MMNAGIWWTIRRPTHSFALYLLVLGIPLGSQLPAQYPRSLDFCNTIDTLSAAVFWSVTT